MTYGRKIQISEAERLEQDKQRWPGITEVEYFKNEFVNEDRKTYWTKGPWMDEPDRIVWRYKDLDCLIVRNHMGALCGYVGVPKGHIAHGLGYDAAWQFHDLQVHGGLTYAAECDEHGRICHKSPSEDKVWWLGFDCAHAGDLMPVAFRGITDVEARRKYETYRDLNYVRSEVEGLADQLIKANTKS